ncbi:unnamed protein product [Danaus chrysippus]|uniref:(African queen) hypothetical protein n=1 Tax=Danaus chrysippus TaxID=151541 RepID=A0A8J2QKU8_9NEOP|nr:unnamed protein product [Danaus chrysippus]
MKCLLTVSIKLESYLFRYPRYGEVDQRAARHLPPHALLINISMCSCERHWPYGPRPEGSLSRTARHIPRCTGRTQRIFRHNLHHILAAAGCCLLTVQCLLCLEARASSDTK